MDLIFLEIFQLICFSLIRYDLEDQLKNWATLVSFNFDLTYSWKTIFAFCFLLLEKGHKYIHACILEVGLSVGATDGEGEGD